MCFVTRVEHTPPATMTVYATKGGSGLAEVLAKNAPAGIDTVVLVETDGDTYTEAAVAGEASA